MIHHFGPSAVFSFACLLGWIGLTITIRIMTSSVKKPTSKGTQGWLSQYAFTALFIQRSRMTDKSFQQGLIPRFPSQLGELFPYGGKWHEAAVTYLQHIFKDWEKLAELKEKLQSLLSQWWELVFQFYRSFRQLEKKHLKQRRYFFVILWWLPCQFFV